MSQVEKVVRINGIKLTVFRSLIGQSLLVNKQLMLEISRDYFRSFSYTNTNSCLKLWMMNSSELINIDSDGLFPEKFDLETSFDMFVLRGDIFFKYLSVYAGEQIDFEYTLLQSNNRWIASNLKMIGIADTGNKLETDFRLTTEDMIVNKIDDYNDVIKRCTPEADMLSLILGNDKVQEIKRLIKKLHKTLSDNQLYLTFTIKANTRELVVNDTVFNISFDLTSEEMNVVPTQDIVFNILKSDFIVSGNNTFTIYFGNNSPQIIFNGVYQSAIMICMFTKVSEIDNNEFTASVTDSTLDTLDIDDFIDSI